MNRHQHARQPQRRWLWITAFIFLAVAVVLGSIWYAGLLQPTFRQTDGPRSEGQPHPGQNPEAAAHAPKLPADLADTALTFGRLPMGPKAEPAIVPDFALPPVQNGLVPVLTRIPTAQKVVFLTIDDGANKTSQEIQLLRSNGIRATLFLAQAFIRDNPDFFKGFVADGSRVEDHSIGHLLNLASLPYEQQKAEICGMSDYELAHYGRRPVFFRPPGGPYNTSMRKAAADCGIRAIIDWEAKANAGQMNYQYGSALRPGDIVLMHFRPEFAADLNAFLAAQKAAGLQVELLEDYLKTG